MCNVLNFNLTVRYKLQLCYIYLQTGVLTGSRGKQGEGMKKKTKKNPNLKIWRKIGRIMLDTDVFAMFNPCNGIG